MDLRHLTDTVLLTRLEALASQERGCVADVVEHLAEVDRRELVVDSGYATLFDYCVKTLRYSEAAAFLRIRAARAAIAFPRVLVDLRSGALHLDAIMRLSPHLNRENCDRILDQAAGANKREVLAMVSRLDISGTAPERDVIRRLPAKIIASPCEAVVIPLESGLFDAASQAAPADTPVIIPPASRIRLSFTADDNFLLMVDRLRSLRRHKFPLGGLEDLLKEAVATMLDKVDPDRRPPHIKRNNPPKPLKMRRYVSIAIRRKVWARDEGRCAYIAPDGRRCDSRDFLEYDHIQPWALGGPSDCLENIRLLCRPHNQRLARRRFGPRRRADLVRPDAPGQGHRPLVPPQTGANAGPS